MKYVLLPGVGAGTGAGYLALMLMAAVLFLTAPPSHATELLSADSVSVLSEELDRARDNEEELVSNATNLFEEYYMTDDIATSTSTSTSISIRSGDHPTTGCVDSTLSFLVDDVKKNCAWVKKNPAERCDLLSNDDVKKFCPETCDACYTHACKNPKSKFYINKKRMRNCLWVKKKKTKKKCKNKGVASTCRALCSEICQFPVIDYVGNPCTDEFGTGMCEVCTGDCDSDEDCADDLRCAKRAEEALEENVPGCRWDQKSKSFLGKDDDFCFMPTSKKGIVNYIGECGEEDYRCGKCEGDCDTDSDCKAGLKCLQRDGLEAVPGCKDEGGLRDMKAKDICYKPPETSSPSEKPSSSPTTAPTSSPTSSPSDGGDNEIKYVGDPCNDFFESGLCAVCTGDCDNDIDCEGDLRCMQRSRRDDVPGCVWGEGSDELRKGGKDFCFMPTSEPGVVNYIGECGDEDYLCGECEGDCDNDTDCKPGLKCFQRDNFETVPGCSGEGGSRDVSGKDMCYNPGGGDNEIKYVGNPCNDSFDSGLCAVCTGDCDNDVDCEGDLRCIQRSSKDDVPGCVWGEGSDGLRDGKDDFCFMPTSEPGVVNYIGECGDEDYLCGECEGDCDNDNSCKPGLKCFQRNDFETVPGCSGEGGSRDVSGKDMCYNPGGGGTEVKYVGNPCNDFFDSGVCEDCTGDCDNDEDCEGDLRCAQRYGGEDVPGCVWGDGSDGLKADNDDFCFMPTSEPGIVNYVGECGSGYLCGECEGDCDNDNSCKPGLKCLNRDGLEAVPGCSGEGGSRDVSGKDICYKPTGGGKEVKYVGNPCGNFFDSGVCEDCTGDCDKDGDCEGDLRCAQRSGGEDVPGCVWGEGSDGLKADDDDFCFMPTSEPGIVNYVGECGSGYKCGECEGDCDDDSDCEGDLQCFYRTSFEAVPGCSGEGGSRDVYSKNICFKPKGVEFLDSLRDTGDGTRCAGPCSNDSDCDGELKCFDRDGSEPVPGCVTGGSGDISGMNYCHKEPPHGNPTYIPGMLTVRENGLELSTGLSSRLIARTGRNVEYDDGGKSSQVFHSAPDGAAVFEVKSGPNAGGWVYASNSESRSNGGVGSISFDSEGKVIHYERVVENTIRNCGGGKTYWGTWVTCEENSYEGQVWEVDPVVGLSSQQQTVIGGTGGAYEAFAYDARDRLNPTFYVTNDIWEGGTVRFTPDSDTVREAEDSGDYSKVLTTLGKLEWLVLAPENSNKEDTKGTFSWTSNRAKGDANASLYYRNAEGIDIRHGFLYMTTKVDKSLFILDLDNLTYVRSSTVSGAFEGQPDQVASIIADDPERDMLYFCEEASKVNNGVHARDTDGNFYTIINGPGLRAETTGLAFSPDNKRMYVSYQGEGKIFEITRDDGYAFGAHRLDIKYHE